MENKYLGTASYVRELERVFAEKMGCKYAVAMNSGTATLHATLLAMGIGPGDEVIVPALGPIMTAAAVVQAGATPVFCDVEPLTLTMDTRGDLWKKLSPNTKAIISVALYGLPCRLNEIQDICKERGIYHIEDNAQCFLATFKGRMVGKWSDAASYSFEESKHITCGEGGIITTDDERLAQEIRKCANHGYACLTAEGGGLPKTLIQRPDYKRHDRIGWNYRLSEHCAAVALPQVERIEELVRRRVAVAEIFKDVLLEYPFFSVQLAPMDRTHSYYTLGAVYWDDGMSWEDFYTHYLEMGGDGIYAAWAVPYTEPALARLGITGACPTAMHLQPKLMQFKTNYDLTTATRKAYILKKLCKQIRYK